MLVFNNKVNSFMLLSFVSLLSPRFSPNADVYAVLNRHRTT